MSLEPWPMYYSRLCWVLKIKSAHENTRIQEQIQNLAEFIHAMRLSTLPCSSAISKFLFNTSSKLDMK